MGEFCGFLRVFLTPFFDPFWSFLGHFWAIFDPKVGDFDGKPLKLTPPPYIYYLRPFHDIFCILNMMHFCGEILRVFAGFFTPFFGPFFGHFLTFWGIFDPPGGGGGGVGGGGGGG